MDACHPKAAFQLIVGAGQPLDVIALKQAPREIGGLVTKMLNRLPKRPQFGFLLLHLSNVSQIPFTHLCSSLLLIICQDLSCLMDEIVRSLQWGPEASSCLEPFHEELV